MWLIVAGTLLAFSSAPAPASASARSVSVDPTAAATACAHGRALDSRLGMADVRFFARYVPCVLRVYRSQAALRYVQNRTLSRLVRSTLTEFVRLPYLSEHSAKAANAEGLIGAGTIAQKLCFSRGSSHPQFQFLWADTSPPPVPSARVFATLLAKSFKNQHGVARRSATVFGFASRRGLLFRKGDLAGATFGMIDVVCK
jgi:hypothetical protein